jgi:hypothetical protein
MQPTPSGKLCYIRFDLVRGEGDYAYGFKPAELGPSAPGEWGVWVKSAARSSANSAPC